MDDMSSSLNGDGWASSHRLRVEVTGDDDQHQHHSIAVRDNTAAVENSDDDKASQVGLTSGTSSLASDSTDAAAAAAPEVDVSVSNLSSNPDCTGNFTAANSSSGTILPVFRSHVPVGDWTRPDPDYTVPLTDGPKRLKRHRRRRSPSNAHYASNETAAGSNRCTIHEPFPRHGTTCTPRATNSKRLVQIESTFDKGFKGSHDDGPDLVRLDSPVRGQKREIKMKGSTVESTRKDVHYKGRRISYRRDTSNNGLSSGGKKGMELHEGYTSSSDGSIRSIIGDLLFGQRQGKDMTRTGEISQEEADSLLDSSDVYEDEYIDMQQEQGGSDCADDEDNSHIGSGIPSNVDTYGYSATRLDGTILSPPRDGEESLADSMSVFQPSSDGAQSLIEYDEMAAVRNSVSHAEKSRGRMRRRPSVDTIDEIAKKIGDRLLRQQQGRNSSNGEVDCVSIGSMVYTGVFQPHKRAVLLLAAVAAVSVGLTLHFASHTSKGNIASSDVRVGRPPGREWGGVIIPENVDESLAPSISQALEDELKQRKRLGTMEDTDLHTLDERDDSTSDEGTKKKKTKKMPLRLLVECSRDKGCLDAMRASASVHIEDVKNSHMVSVDIDDGDFDKLRGLKHVKRIDIDFDIIGIEGVLIDESEVANEDQEDGFEPYRNGTLVKQGSRNLAQTIPAGAIMVQAVSSDGTPFPMGRSPRKICIADTGACRDHPDINSNPEHLWGTDMVVDGRTVLPWAPDRNGHGCHLTGLVAALDNGIGYHGISTVPGGVKVFSTRALGDDMSGSLSQMEAAIDQCVSNDADIIVLSLGCTNCYSETMKNYFDRIASKNIMVFAAAGNNGNDVNPDKFYPASYPSVISVGAVNKHEGLWYMSNRNDAVELCAHGYYVYSTDFDRISDTQFAYNYSPRAGTSMAVPQVAAVAAMLWSHFPSCSATDIRAALAKTAKPNSGQSSCNDQCGHGIVQLAGAYDLLDREGCSGGHPILSSSSSTCACVDSNYGSSSCLNPAPPQQAQDAQAYYSSPPQRTNYLPLCQDDVSARFRKGDRRELGNRNSKQKQRSCQFIKRSWKRATNWCYRSSGASTSCKRTCSEMAGISYSGCRPRNL